MVRPGMRTSSVFLFSTRRNTAAKRAFCDMLGSNVAIAWPELNNVAICCLERLRLFGRGFIDDFFGA